RILGPHAFAGQMQQSPQVKGENILQRGWWKLFPEGGETFGPDGKPSKPLELPPMATVICSIDTAMTTRDSSDYSAITIWGIFQDKQGLNRTMLMFAKRGRWDFHELVAQIQDTCAQFKANPVDHVLIEAKNNGFAVATELRRQLRNGGEFLVHLVDVKGD